MSDARPADLSPAERRALLARLLAARGAAPAAPRRAVASFAQRQFWLLEQLAPGTALHTIAGAVRITAPVDAALIGRSLGELTRRHEALRTALALEGGELLQVIGPAPGPAWALDVPVTDLAGAGPAGRAAEAERAVAEEAQRPFDLARGPLLRARVLRLGADEHVLILAMHHAISDGWSLGVLMREALTVYEAFARGAPSPLPPLPIQYADYAAWQREWLGGGRVEPQLAYWADRLVGVPPLDLPTDRPRPAAPTWRGATRRFALPADLTAGLKELSRREGATLFMVLLAGFGALLARHAGQDDVAVGTLVAGRDRIETEGLIGCFVNALALRLDCAGDPPFRALLARARETCLAAYAHQDVPFDAVIERLQPAREAGRTPLFQAMLLLQDTAASHLSLPGLEILDADTGTARFDLNLSLVEEAGALTGMLRYPSDLFDAATADRLVERLETVLHAAAADPTRRLSALPLMSAEERRRVLVDFNQTEASWPVPPDGAADVRARGGDGPADTLPTMFAAQARRTPEAVAVVFESQAVTYRALASRASALGRRLRALGVGPEARVGVHLERSVELVVALLGILDAGAAYVPLDVGAPRERLAVMVEEAGIEVAVTSPGPGHAIDGLAKLVAVDSEPAPVDAPGADDAEDGAPRAAADNLAYVIYTSGSTGRPKGAMNSHRGIRNRLLWMQSAYGLTADDRVLQKTPMGFDVSVWELFWPLITGARLVVARPGGHQDSAYLARVIREEAITTAHFVPPMLQVFLEEPAVDGCGSLRRVICSGEALSPAAVDRFHARLPRAELHNLYGPTEAAVDVTAWRCEPGHDAVPIGRPVANTQIRILDARMEPAPIGVTGELYIGGVQVGRGYVGRPELTAERFVPDPFSAPGARLYRTGDLARYRADGAIEYLGRADHQVKVLGIRIELGEIEAALVRHPAVRRAVAVGGADPGGGSRLVAYVVPAEMPGPGAEALRAFLRETLPEYMIPWVFVELPALPLLPSGKVDRRALPAPDPARRDAAAPYAEPATPLERELAALWQEALRVERVGRHDSFFVLGGHSLLAAQLVARVRERYRVELPLPALFADPTVANLARLIERAEAERQEQERVDAILREIEGLSADDAREGLARERGDAGAA